jgi:hypothetical protein
MKPFPAALPTEEDFQVWLSLARRQRFRVFGPDGVIAKIRESDRRDAALMFRAQTVVTNRQGPLWLAFDAIAGTTDWEFGGCDVSGWRPGTMRI